MGDRLGTTGSDGMFFEIMLRVVAITSLNLFLLIDFSEKYRTDDNSYVY